MGSNVPRTGPGDTTERATVDQQETAPTPQAGDGAPASPDTPPDDALARHRARRIEEIRAGAHLPERGFLPAERLRELADGVERGGALGPGPVD
jgi:hypothetical protein